jgi:hypothetical protein
VSGYYLDPYREGTGDCYPGDKATLGHDPDHSPTSNTEVKNGGLNFSFETGEALILEEELINMHKVLAGMCDEKIPVGILRGAL